MPVQERDDDFPLQFIVNAFSLLFKALFQPRTLNVRKETGPLLIDHSLSELILKLQDKVFPLATDLLKLCIASIFLVVLTDGVAYY